MWRVQNEGGRGIGESKRDNKKKCPFISKVACLSHRSSFARLLPRYALGSSPTVDRTSRSISRLLIRNHHRLLSWTRAESVLETFPIERCISSNKVKYSQGAHSMPGFKQTKDRKHFNSRRTSLTANMAFFWSFDHISQGK